MQRVDEEVTCFVDIAVGGVGVAMGAEVALAYTDGEDSFLARHRALGSDKHRVYIATGGLAGGGAVLGL